MRLLIFLSLSAILPLLVAAYLCRRGKCSFLFVILAPIIGIAAFAMLLMVLVLCSGDM